VARAVPPGTASAGRPAYCLYRRTLPQKRGLVMPPSVLASAPNREPVHIFVSWDAAECDVGICEKLPMYDDVSLQLLAVDRVCQRSRETAAFGVCSEHHIQ
jgi:hypothetical protein